MFKKNILSVKNFLNKKIKKISEYRKIILLYTSFVFFFWLLFNFLNPNIFKADLISITAISPQVINTPNTTCDVTKDLRLYNWESKYFTDNFYSTLEKEYIFWNSSNIEYYDN